MPGLHRQRWLLNCCLTDSLLTPRVSNTFHAVFRSITPDIWVIFWICLFTFHHGVWRIETLSSVKKSLPFSSIHRPIQSFPLNRKVHWSPTDGRLGPLWWVHWLGAVMMCFWFRWSALSSGPGFLQGDKFGWWRNGQWRNSRTNRRDPCDIYKIR